MLIVNAVKGQTCASCGRGFKKDELVGEHQVHGIICIEGCFKKPDASQEATATGLWTSAPKKPMQQHAPEPQAPASDLLQDTMGDKLVDDINAIGRRK